MHPPTSQARAMLSNLLTRSEANQSEALAIANQLCDALDEADGEIERLSATFAQKTRKLLRRIQA